MTLVRLVKSSEVPSIAGVRLRANVIQAEVKGREMPCRGTVKHGTRLGSLGLIWVCLTSLGFGKRKALQRYRSITLNTTVLAMAL